MKDEETLRFYAVEAAAYAAGARQAQASRLAGFLARLTPGARILELGCGGGVDAAAMQRLGFEVDATDGSPEMAAQAAARLGRPARVMAFDALDADAAYDGVWANASLLHVPRDGLAGVLWRGSTVRSGPGACSMPATRPAPPRAATGSAATTTIRTGPCSIPPIARRGRGPRSTSRNRTAPAMMASRPRGCMSAPASQAEQPM